MYYSSFGILALIMHIIVNADKLFRSHKKGPNAAVRGRFRAFLFSIMIFYISDIIWGALYESKIVPLAYADTVVFFVSMAMTLLLWIRFINIYLNRFNTTSRIIHYIAWSIFTSELIVIIINFFYPLMFTFKADGEYVPGPARYLLLVIHLILFSLISLITLVRAAKTKDRDRLHHNAICISGIVMALFVALQAQYPLLPFYAIGCLIATSIINTYVVVDERMTNAQQLGTAKAAAFKDSLTSIRNANAFNEYKTDLENKVRKGVVAEYGLVVFDLNDLKTVNDTQGHDAGDRYIREGSRLICTAFKHSPVFRIGGDEFVAVLLNDDYQHRDGLVASFNRQVDENLKNRQVVISAGMSTFVPGQDSCVNDVFARADERMYVRKKELKNRRA